MGPKGAVETILGRDIISEVEQFRDLLESQKEGFPYQQLRNHTAHRCHRYKQLEKDIFQNFKDTDPSSLSKVRSNLAEVLSSFIQYLEALEEDSIEIPAEGRILENRLTFKALSDPERITITPEEEQKLNKIGFEDAFANLKDWFDSRIEKLLWEYLLFRMCDSCQLM